MSVAITSFRRQRQRQKDREFKASQVIEKIPDQCAGPKSNSHDKIYYFVC